MSNITFIMIKPDAVERGLIGNILKDIKIPVLAIQGKDDPYGTISQIEILEENLKGKLKKLILNNCGHNPLIDKPKESINKIKEFIDQIENK